MAKAKRLKSQSLSVFLLKDAIVASDEAVRNHDKDINKLKAKVANESATLAFKQFPNHRPDWVQFLSAIAGGALDKLSNSGSAAALILKRSNRLFAITFGYGRSLLKPDSYEENFGLKVVLNSVNPDKIRSVDVRSLDAVPVAVRSQASVATEFSGFGLDIEQDLLYAATGEPIDNSLGKAITGKDSLKLSIPILVEGLPALLDKLLIQFNADTYKKQFAWVDHLQEVRTPSEISELDDALIKKVQAENFARTWLAIPDIIEWADLDGFKYQRPKQAELLQDIDWESYLKFLGGKQKLSAEVLRSQCVYSISKSTGLPRDDWMVYKCVYGEVELGGQTHALNNGKWYRIEQNFLKSVNTAVNAIKKSNLALPDYNDTSEGAYNERVHKAEPTKLALMDKINIAYGGGSSKIEFCDLYSMDHELIHVKRYGGSSVLSHLFAQGLVSARLMLSDPEFMKLVNAKLPSSHCIVLGPGKLTASDFEVVYAVASNSSDADLELPLFSKINLRNSHSQLRLLGINVSIKSIKVLSG